MLCLDPMRDCFGFGFADSMLFFGSNRGIPIRGAAKTSGV